MRNSSLEKVIGASSAAAGGGVAGAGAGGAVGAVGAAGSGALCASTGLTLARSRHNSAQTQSADPDFMAPPGPTRRGDYTHITFAVKVGCRARPCGRLE